MSCRVLGRQMEQFMVRRLLLDAAAAGAVSVKGVYLPSAKNSLVKGLYPRMGFLPTGEEGVYRFRLDEGDLPACDFIADANS